MLAEFRNLVDVDQPLVLCMFSANAYLWLNSPAGAGRNVSWCVVWEQVRAPQGLQRGSSSALGTAGTQKRNGPAISLG